MSDTKLPKQVKTALKISYLQLCQKETPTQVSWAEVKRTAFQSNVLKMTH